MIAKELEALNTSDPRLKAGHEAERQMAFYLRRAFAESEQVRVFHNLRLERADEVAQLDHLILHRSGMIIVESKSVTGEVRVNAQGEWSRHWGRRSEGMPSPVLQARRQGALLKNLLRDHATELLETFAFGLLQKRFGSMAVDVLVAISDQGQIDRQMDVPELCKADQVPGRIQATVEHYRRANRPVSLNFRDGGYTFSETELTRLTAFLRNRHTPLIAPPERAQRPGPVAPPPRGGMAAASSRPVCRHCQASDLELLYGKYGYYFKCRACAGNTAAKPACPTCQSAARLRKDGPRFFVECPQAHSQLYWTN